ncbi:MAG: radical SAM protein [Desulfovibrionaceae bacterium]|nr:radical SAM protein [Desulfovibrionaceae bacterium]MBF0514260.1 radical SAM protein [Desulfovibrionaceae bacterium]
MPAVLDPKTSGPLFAFGKKARTASIPWPSNHEQPKRSDVKYLHNIKEMNAEKNYINSEINAGYTLSFPELIALTLLEKCNFNCIMCDQNHGSDLRLAESGLDKIIDILPFAKNICLTGGEPFLYDQIDSLIENACQAQCNVYIQTNGSLLNDEKIDYIFTHRVAGLKISCDGATSSTYDTIRKGGSFRRLKASLERINDLRRKLKTPYPVLEFNFVAMQDNIFELSKLVALAREQGVVRINVFALLAYTEEQARKSLYFHQELSDYHVSKARAVARELGVDLCAPPLFCETQPAPGNEAPRVKCLSLWNHMTVNVTGEVAICCGGAGNAGNINEMEFTELWNHPKRAAIRETVNTPDEPACCRNCRMVKQDSANPRSHIQDPGLLETVLDKLAGEGNKHALGALALP